MRNFDLYVSGILYGRLRLGDGTPQIRKLDVHTGALLDWQDLTEQDRDFYRFFVKMDFAALGQNLSHYESGLHGTGEVSLCGERYTSEDGCSYLQRDVKFPNNKQMKEGRLIAVTCPAREMVTVLVLILIGMCTQERFFCQFLCPMGAVFAMMPILPSALFNRNKEKCPSKCGLCRKRCPAHLEIDGDTPLSGECICCHACQVTCPRKNIQIGPKIKNQTNEKKN
jgi:ferredoxin